MKKVQFLKTSLIFTKITKTKCKNHKFNKNNNNYYNNLPFISKNKINNNNTLTL